MAVNDRLYVTVKPYAAPTSPDYSDQVSFARHLLQQLQSIERTLTDLAEASLQVTDIAPHSPRFGTVRYAIGGWATALGAGGLYIYKETGWTRII